MPKACISSQIAALLLVAGLAFAPMIARADSPVYLTFSGGNGSPLSVTVSTPIDYTITTSGVGGQVINFQSVGNLFPSTWLSITSSATYSIDGGSAITPDTVNTGYAGNDIAGDDMYIYSNFDVGNYLNPGDDVVLSAGTFTTTTDVSAAAPSDGYYTTFITDDYGNDLTVVPEASTTAAVFGGVALLGTAFYRRRRTAASKA